MANKRITQLTETSTLSTGDYTIIDNSSGGTKKYDFGSKLNTLTSNIGTLSSLTTTAKTNLVAAINEVKASGSGSGSGGTNVLIVTDSNGTLNKTINELKTAMSSGTPVFLKYAQGDSSTFSENYRMSPVVFIYKYGSTDSDWRIAVEEPVHVGSTVSGKSLIMKPSITIYSASSPSDYPVFYTTVSYTTATVSNNNPHSI